MRYVLFDEIACGGMGAVHFGRLVGPVGFSRTVAIKRPHPHLVRDPEFVEMFVDEARLAARVKHANVVATIDVVSQDDDLYMVMEYVAGESLARVVRALRDRGAQAPLEIAAAIACDVLAGLHAAHEATTESGQPLGIVHRDVSPHNVLVGVDGVTRVLDFGVAKARSRVHDTRRDGLKGKLAYMAPEQLRRGPLDRRADVYAASVVLWELLTGARLFEGDHEGDLIDAVLDPSIDPPSARRPGIPPALDAIVLRGLARSPDDRFDTARAMATALEDVLAPARPARVGAWLEEVAGEGLARRTALVAAIEQTALEPGTGAELVGGRAATAALAVDPGTTQPLGARAGDELSTFTEDDGGTRAPVTRHVTRPRARGARLLLPGGVLAAGAAVAIALGSSSSSRPDAASANSASPPPEAVADVDAQPPPTVAITPDVAPAPIVSAQARGAAPRPAARPRRSVKPACDPPFYFDDSGVKRFKPGCV